jgi:hypothetical protein
MGPWGPWDFRSGEPRPERVRPGGVLADVRWEARWFAWAQEKTDPRRDLERWRALAESPLARDVVSNFVDPFGGNSKVRERVAKGPFGMIAKTSVPIARPGRYALSVVSDDGVRVLIDGEKEIENWTHHAAATDSAELTLEAGEHALAIEYFQIDGASALSIELRRIGD